ncbi:MAG: hemerythrin domain-containing protein [Candidatus Baltobacteraceae bacterium]
MHEMNRRIDMHTCRQHHEALRILLDRFPESLPLDAADFSKLVSRLSTLLLTHLKLEDDLLYPALELSEDRTVRDTAIRYRQEMGGLKDAFMKFVSTWGTEDAIAANQAGCLDAWLKVRAALEVRMAKEDHGLYSIADDHLSRDETA